MINTQSLQYPRPRFVPAESVLFFTSIVRSAAPRLTQDLETYSPETRRHSPLGNGIRDRHYRSNVLPISLFSHCPKQAIREQLTACRALSRTTDVLFFTSVAEHHIPNWRHPMLWSSLNDGNSGNHPLGFVHPRSPEGDTLTGNLQTCSRFASRKSHTVYACPVHTLSDTANIMFF
jgi:hypothetical protein